MALNSGNMNYDVVSRPGCCDCWVRLVLRSKVVVSALGMGQVTYDHMKGNNNPAIPAILGQRTRVLIQYLRSGEVVDGKGKSPAVEGLTGAVGEEGFRNLHVEPIGCLPCQCQNASEEGVWIHHISCCAIYTDTIYHKTSLCDSDKLSKLQTACIFQNQYFFAPYITNWKLQQLCVLHDVGNAVLSFIHLDILVTSSGYWWR